MPPSRMSQKRFSASGESSVPRRIFTDTGASPCTDCTTESMIPSAVSVSCSSQPPRRRPSTLLTGQPKLMSTTS